MFVGLLSACTTGSFGKSLASNSEGSSKLVSLNSRTCQARPTLTNINSNERLYYPFTVTFNKFGESCNTTDGPYVRLCVKIRM